MPPWLGLVKVSQHTPLMNTALPPSFVIMPPEVAEVLVIFIITFVVMVGRVTFFSSFLQEPKKMKSPVLQSWLLKRK